MGGYGGDLAACGLAVAGGGMITLPGMAEIWALLPEARMVGGAVRDMLAGRAVADVDFASPLAPEAVMARALKAGIKAIPTGLAHGTVTLLAAGRGFEVTSLRRDIETDGRHARVAFTDDWQEDAARRDFTINAMSCTRAGQVFDYFGGQADLASGVVRFVGLPAQRIAEDYLRILRFFRFYARYGRAAPAAGAMAAIAANAQRVCGLSPERVWDELKKILRAPAPLEAVQLMQQSGVLTQLLPGARLERLAAFVAKNAPVEPLLRLAALTDEDVAVRLRLSGAEARTLASWRAPLTIGPEDDEAALSRALADCPADQLIARTWLRGDETAAWAGLRARLALRASPVFPLQGRDLLALGAVAGPALGVALANTRRWWLAGGCVADKAACLAYARGEV